MKVKVYVEGGGDHNKALQTQCRQGFAEFIRKAGMDGRMPKVIACGSRKRAFDNFQTSHQSEANVLSMLLVDSEGPVETAPWEHVRTRRGDGWLRSGASDDQLHLMVQTMEAWFHADRDTLERYFGPKFRTDALSPRADVEAIPKRELFDGLKWATANCSKGEYAKGEHSFEILARIDPQKVANASAHAVRLVKVLRRECAR